MLWQDCFCRDICYNMGKEDTARSFVCGRIYCDKWIRSVVMKEQVIRSYPYRTELHCHTLPVSGCSHIYAPEMVRLYKKLGVDTIVLTNHCYKRSGQDISDEHEKEEAVKAYLQSFQELKSCAEAEGIVAIMGMEIRFAESSNDYLVYGLSEAEVSSAFDYLDGDLKRFYKAFKKESCLIFQAHPFRDHMVLADPEYLDGIEAFNLYPRANSRVALASAYARQQGMRVIGGSDCHVQGHEGCCLLRTRQRIETSEDLISVLKSGDYVFDVFGSIILP